MGRVNIKFKAFSLVFVLFISSLFLFPHSNNQPSITIRETNISDIAQIIQSKPTVKDKEDTSSQNVSVKTDEKKILPPTPNSIAQTEIRQAVEKEFVYQALLTANDPYYASSWALQKVNASTAWDISTGNGETIVAVIDTGFALNHEDLTDSWFINQGEYGLTNSGDICWTGSSENKSTNNCDDDENGYIDDWRGWNFVIGDNNPMAGRTNSTGEAVSHGTETAGLTGATGNNNKGITTINWSVKIIPLQALDDDGTGYTSDVAAAVYYAVDNGADVINMSLGGNDYDETLEAATDYAFENNVVVVAAAGNCGSVCDDAPVGSMSYPALNNHVISVGATTSTDQRASFSSYGPELDIVAPGSGSIVSTTWSRTNGTSLYATSLYGTSYASPQVASLVSLIKSIRPNTSVEDVTALLLANPTKLSAMSGNIFTNYLGHGIINANLSLQVASSLNEGELEPVLLQTGNSVTEHRYSTNQTIATGCQNSIDSYCAIVLRDEQNGHVRYLPYKQIGASSIANWSWNSSLIGTSSWRLQSIQGELYSPTYQLSIK